MGSTNRLSRSPKKITKQIPILHRLSLCLAFTHFPVLLIKLSLSSKSKADSKCEVRRQIRGPSLDRSIATCIFSETLLLSIIFSEKVWELLRTRCSVSFSLTHVCERLKRHSFKPALTTPHFFFLFFFFPFYFYSL